MHLILTFMPAALPLVLSVHYNNLLQGLVYSLLREDLARFIHDTGFTVGQRHFRLFAFSRLLGHCDVDRLSKTITFHDRVSIVVASPLASVCQDLADSIIRREEVRLGNAYLNLVQVRTENPQVLEKDITIETLSPITTYSTMFRADGARYTCYFHPRESDFGRIIHENLTRKYQAIYEKTYQGEGINIRPLGGLKQNIILYRAGVIKGYSGRFHLKGDPLLLQVGLDCGYGSKNPQGFGLCRLAPSVSIPTIRPVSVTHRLQPVNGEIITESANCAIEGGE